ncbi:MAG: YifB family Mg chelatase-like AAA ATPase [Opitutales bacterium]
MLGITQSAALIGVEAHPVQVEVNTGEAGELKLILVGLPDTAVKESQDRVFSAISNSGYRRPETRTTINLAPGDLRKEGPAYDLPIALGILASMKQCQADNLKQYMIAGELSLSGQTRPIKGALAMAMLTRKSRLSGLIVPSDSAEEAALVDEVKVYPVDSLDHAVRFLNAELEIKPKKSAESRFYSAGAPIENFDFAEVKGQQAVRRAIEIAVSGGHNLLMIGSPGSGKSMIAKRVPSIMPEPDLNEFLEILSIQSAAGITLRNQNREFRRPFRSPHHTISDVGLLGGGTIPGPGELSLAHNGVLFLDELPEFKRSALEVLRQPLEDGHVTISRSAGKVTLPCNVMLIAAMNPCPCGYTGDPTRECRCTVPQIQRYRARISGPLLDRIDLHIEAPALRIEELRENRPAESSAAIRARCIHARSKQLKRFQATSTRCNAHMQHSQIRNHCQISAEQGVLLQQAMEQLALSARAYDRILKVARTIADLADSTTIDTAHLLEAIQYRSLDRNLFF